MLAQLRTLRTEQVLLSMVENEQEVPSIPENELEVPSSAQNAREILASLVVCRKRQKIALDAREVPSYA